MKAVNLELPSALLAKSLIKANKSMEELSKSLHPLFLQRLTGKINQNEYNVSYISDLGLRRTDEPTRYFIENACIFIKGNPDLIKSLKLHDSTIMYLAKVFNIELNTKFFNFQEYVRKNINQLGLLQQAIKYYVDIIGNWSDADILANNITQYIDILPQNEESAKLLSHCGNLYAHQGDEKCIEIYLRSHSLWKENYYQKFSSIFRIAVASIKRLDNADVTYWLNETYKISTEFGKKTNNNLNTTFCKALILNLEALYWLNKKNMSEVGSCISEAFKIVSNINVDRLDINIDISNRYIIQIIENFGMYSGLTSKWDAAIPVMKTVIDIGRKSHKESLPEALAFLGFVLCKANKITEAIPILLESENLFAKSIWTDKINQIRKMLAIAYNKLGENKKSTYWINQISHLYNGAI